jgi:hypothetical protein
MIVDTPVFANRELVSLEDTNLSRRLAENSIQLIYAMFQIFAMEMVTVCYMWLNKEWFVDRLVRTHATLKKFATVCRSTVQAIFSNR